MLRRTCRKRWKEDNVAKEMLMRCAEKAVGTATSEVKDALPTEIST